MPNLHFSPKTHQYEICRAQKCRYGGEEMIEKSKFIASAYVARDGELAEYYEATDRKHFGLAGNTPGSKFTDPRLTKLEDVVALAFQQRGHLEGDDREFFIQQGSTADAFKEGNRYLKVETSGVVGILHASELQDDTMVTVQRTKPGVPCSLVVEVTERPHTDYGVIVLATHEKTGKAVVVTAFPGLVTEPLSNEHLDLLEGKQLSMADARHLLGSKFWVNTTVL